MLLLSNSKKYDSNKKILKTILSYLNKIKNKYFKRKEKNQTIASNILDLNSSKLFFHSLSYCCYLF